MGNVLRFSTEMDDKVSKKLTGISKAFDKIGGPGSGASLFGNVGAKAVAKGFSLVEDAASGVVDVLGDALKAAMEEEESVHKLDTALRANIAGWDGNTEAIERVLLARENLGFSDDEQRQSLALLVAATNDVAKSLDIQRTAMDLARLKNVDLQTATEALIKVDDGHYRALQALGIVLGDNATSTDALAAVQAAAKGQAEDYANTTSGKLLVAQTKIGEKMEDLGGVIMPAVASALTSISDAIDYFSGDPTKTGSAALETLRSAFRAIGDVVAWVIDKVSKLIGLLGDVIGVAGKAIDVLGKLPGGLGDTLNNISKLPGGLGDALTGNRHAFGGQLGTGWNLVGENGPELIHGDTVHTAGQTAQMLAGQSSGVRIQGISEHDILDMVDRGLYFRLQRAAPTLSPSGG
jgi:hypothetical protein